MNEFLVLFLIVSSFAFDALCMNPSSTNPSNMDLPTPTLPDNIDFRDCFVVPKITGEVLKTATHHYHHICPEKDLNDGRELPGDGKLWYFVGSCTDSKLLQSREQDPSQFHYLRTRQSLIRFVFMREEKVELVFTFAKLEITFQSHEQGQAFYKMIYSNSNMKQVTATKIGVLHEIMLDETKYREMGRNVEALYERINGTLYITFKHGLGKPLLIFSRDEANISNNISPWVHEMQQQLLRINTAFYILTFSSTGNALRFGDSLSEFLKKLHMGHVFGPISKRFRDNVIKIDS